MAELRDLRGSWEHWPGCCRPRQRTAGFIAPLPLDRTHVRRPPGPALLVATSTPGPPRDRLSHDARV